MVDAAHRAWLRLGRDVLAQAARLASGRRVGAAAPGAARAPGPSPPAGLEPCLGRRSQPRCKKGGAEAGPNPVDRARPGTKHHLLVDAAGVPLAALLSAANRNDSKLLEPLLDAVRPVKTGRRGRPRQRPAKLHADKGYDHAFCRRLCRARGIKARIARRGIESSAKLGRHRWVVERTFAWLARYRRLAVRYERRADIHLAFLTLGCALICFNYLQRQL